MCIECGFLKQTCSDDTIGPCDMMAISEYYKLVDSKSSLAKKKINDVIKNIELRSEELIKIINQNAKQEKENMSKRLDEILKQIDFYPKQFDLDSIYFNVSIDSGLIKVETKKSICRKIFDQIFNIKFLKTFAFYSLCAVGILIWIPISLAFLVVLAQFFDNIGIKDTINQLHDYLGPLYFTILFGIVFIALSILQRKLEIQ